MVRKLYNTRSKFVHTGKSDIDARTQNEALDISRRVIGNLLLVRDDIDKTSDTLHTAGFGENPYKSTL